MEVIKKKKKKRENRRGKRSGEGERRKKFNKTRLLSSRWRKGRNSWKSLRSLVSETKTSGRKNGVVIAETIFSQFSAAQQFGERTVLWRKLRNRQFCDENTIGVINASKMPQTTRKEI